MKRVLLALVALMIACMCIPAMAEVTAADVSGEWFLIEMKMGESSMDPSMLGIEMIMTLNEDGTVLLRSINADGEDTQDGSWALVDGAVQLTADEETATLALEDGNLAGEMSGFGLVFSREKSEGIVIPQVITADSEDAFLGTWNLSLVNMDGSIFPVDVYTSYGIELAGTLNIEAGTASLKLTFSTELPEVTGTTALEDGKLLMTVEGLTAPISIQATDTGALYMEFTIAEMDMTLPLYFEKAE